MRMLDPWVKYFWVFENRVMRWAPTPAEIATTTNCIRFEEILLFKTDVSSIRSLKYEYPLCVLNISRQRTKTK